MAHSRPNQENPPKHKLIMTNISYTYSYNSLTNFDNKAHAKKLKLPCEKIVRLIQVNLILAGFSYLEPLCSGRSWAARDFGFFVAFSSKLES